MEVLKPYRKQIDALDKQIIDLLRKRFDIIDQVSVIKERDNIAPALQDRIDEVRENAATYAGTLGIDKDLIRSIWAQLIQHSCEVEERNINAAKQEQSTK